MSEFGAYEHDRNYLRWSSIWDLSKINESEGISEVYEVDDSKYDDVAPDEPFKFDLSHHDLSAPTGEY